MNRIVFGNMAVLLIAAILLGTPTRTLADGVGDGYVATANGYQVELVFKEPAQTGENEFHIQIVDAMGMPVSNAEVEVSAMPVEGMSAHDESSEMEMATEAPSVGVMTSNSGGMDMAAEVPSTGVMKPNEPAADEHSEEALTIMLEPATESGEYSGKLHFEKSGEWMLNVHFTVAGETTKVEFPIEIARALGLNYAVLAGFFGINVTVIVAAASLKRKSLVIRK
ncbi:MAG: FixH family protein [Chloroflexi bacterium]|nr:FixH family protein [Chloroflexota bacterium]